MGILEDASLAADKMRAIRAWASVSFPRTMLVVSLIGIALLGAQYGYVNSLLTEAKRSGENRSQEITLLGKENGYKVALDAITLCMDSVKDKPKLHTWYCMEAVRHYKQASTNWPHERVTEVIDRLAYGAMKNDVSHYIRSVDLDRAIHHPATKEEELLNLLLSKTVVGLWIFIVATIMFGVYLTLWVLPSRKSIAPDAEPLG